MRIAVVGGGWAGLSAAVRARQAGHEVVLHEMAQQLGGRARSVPHPQLTLDNGQHILIGAYLRALDLMRCVGVDLQAALDRRPLELRYPDGRGLRLPRGPAWLTFTAAVLNCEGWSARDRWSLMRAATGWMLAGFRCEPGLTVDQLCADLPPAVRQLLIDPLCVAALNTPAPEASAQVLLRVLHDALFSGRGSADLLLPRQALSELLASPAERWLRRHGVEIRFGSRAETLQPRAAGWEVAGEGCDAVVLACTASQAAKLAEDIDPHWAHQASSLRYEPIVTVYLHGPGARLPAPMMALVEGPRAPAQFVFDHGALGATPGLFAFVVSGAAAWVERGLDATGAAVMEQALSSFPRGTWPESPTLLKVLAEKRATFRCTPHLRRPPTRIAPRLVAAGDYIAGPYPATLEGAVRAGEAAIAALS